MQYAKLIPRNSETITMRLKASRIKLPTYTGERVAPVPSLGALPLAVALTTAAGKRV